MINKSMLKRVIIIGLVIIFSVSYVRQIITVNRIKDEISQKKIELEKVKSDNRRLKDEVSKIDEGSTEYLEKLARERLGMIKPGEKVVKNIEEPKENKESK